MAQQGEADIALLREAGNPLGDLAGLVRYGYENFSKSHLHDCRSFFPWYNTEH